jgi:4-amino-4-deoxy-L-arabinose transferase-like glycosyltransferase
MQAAVAVLAHYTDVRRLPWRERLRMCLVLAASCSSLGADLGALAAASRPIAQWWWIASVVLLLLAAAVPTRRLAVAQLLKLDLLRIRRAVMPDVVLLAIVLGLALWLRLPNLAQVPYVVHGDEAACGLQALRWLHGQVTTLLDTGWYGLPVGGYGVPALVMRVFGANLYGLRLSSVLVGLISIAATYALAREFGGRRFATVAASLLAVSHVHIQFSRMGIHYIHAVCVVVLTLWLFVRALRGSNVIVGVLAGVGMSLALQVYFSARIVFLIIPLLLAGMVLLRYGELRRVRQVLVWFGASALISMGPLLAYFAVNPAPLQDRTQEVFILSSNHDVYVHLMSQFGTAALGPVLQRQIAAVPLIFGGLADQSLQYGPHAPLLDPVVAALALAGMAVAVTRMRHLLCWLLAVWVGTTVVAGGVLTIDIPWWPRLVVMLPALCILAALMVEVLAQGIASAFLRLASLVAPVALDRRIRMLAVAYGSILAVWVLGVSATQSFQHYFVEYPKLVNADPDRTRFTDVGRYAAQLPAHTFVLLYTLDDVDLHYDTIQFLAPLDGQTVHSGSEVQKAVALHSAHLVIVIMPSAQSDFEQLVERSALPAGTYHAYVGVTGVPVFNTYEIASGTERLGACVTLCGG